MFLVSLFEQGFVLEFKLSVVSLTNKLCTAYLHSSWNSHPTISRSAIELPYLNCNTHCALGFQLAVFEVRNDITLPSAWPSPILSPIWYVS
jgi:hypothetical protein